MHVLAERLAEAPPLISFSSKTTLRQYVYVYTCTFMPSSLEDPLLIIAAQPDLNSTSGQQSPLKADAKHGVSH